MAKFKRPIERWASRDFAAGDGLHSDLYTAACFLLEEGQADPVVFDFLRRAADQVQDRTVPDREILSAIAYARAKVAGERVSERWPSIMSEYRAEVIRHHPASLEVLTANADRLPQNPSNYLPYLYRKDELVCIAAANNSFDTLPLSEVVEISKTHALEFINPSPMLARKGTTLEGKISSHCEENTGPRVYLVTEFDVGTPYEQASIIKYLSTKLRLVMIVYSGGKSIHGWFLTDGIPENYVKTFFDDAVRLGADTVTWSRCQFCRMPAGRNNKSGRNQNVLYFRNPNRPTP